MPSQSSGRSELAGVTKRRVVGRRSGDAEPATHDADMTARAVTRSRTPVVNSAWLPWVVRSASLLVLVGVWEYVGRQQETSLFFVPISVVAGALWHLIQSGEFWDAYRQTMIPFLWGWVLAMGVGIVVGLIIGRFRVVLALTTPYLTFLNALPVSTLVPVAVILLGIGYPSRVLVVFLFAVVEIILNTAAGVRYVDREMVEMGRSFHGNEWRLFRKVILPASGPGIMAGVRIGTGRAVVGMVVVEILLVAVGVGRLILRFRGRFQSAELYAVVLSLIIFGIALLALARWVERRVSRWKLELEAVS